MVRLVDIDRPGESHLQELNKKLPIGNCQDLSQGGNCEETASILEMSENLNATTSNGTQPSGCLNLTAERIGKTIAYCLLFVVSLAGNTFIGIIVYKTKPMRKPINFFIVNMAVSDLLYPIFLFPLDITRLYLGIDSWLISGPLGQALCKLVPFVADASAVVSIQSLVLIAVDRFGAVVFPLRSPLISSKLCPFFILATWIVAAAIHIPDMFAWKLVDDQGRLVCEWRWIEVFGQSSSFSNYYFSFLIVLFCIPLFLLSFFTLQFFSNSSRRKFQASNQSTQENDVRQGSEMY